MLLGLRVAIPPTTCWGVAGQEPASAVYLTDDANVAETLLDKAIAGCGADDVEEIRSLGTTGCECCSTPAVSPSPASPGHPASGPALPTQNA